MGETKIEWAHYTFNPWRGCSKVSPGCKNCYAESMSRRNPAVLGEWGEQGSRVIAAESYWQMPLKWNSEAKKAGTRRRVFCASMGDIFEDRPELIDPRMRLFDLIRRTPDLDWLLLTKRPENICPILETIGKVSVLDADRYNQTREWLQKWQSGELPANVWLGASVENQETVDQRLPILLQTPAKVRFLSCEPLLEEIDLRLTVRFIGGVVGVKDIARDLHWVIVGGESGPHARPMNPQWARSIRDQCQPIGIPFFFKQWGEWFPRDQWEDNPDLILPDDDQAYKNSPRTRVFRDLRDFYPVHRVGKKAAGRRLDGETCDEFPGGNLE